MVLLFKILFCYFLKCFLKIYLAVPSFSWDMQDLRSSSQRVGNLAVACGIQFPAHGWSPAHLHWERRVLATGLPGKSQRSDSYPTYQLLRDSWAEPTQVSESGPALLLHSEWGPRPIWPGHWNGNIAKQRIQLQTSWFPIAGHRPPPNPQI